MNSDRKTCLSSGRGESGANVENDVDAYHDLRRVSSRMLHDFNGPLVTASGFVEELQHLQRDVLALTESLPPDTDAALCEKLKEQLEHEMPHCLNRVSESLAQLGRMIDRLRPLQEE